MLSMKAQLCPLCQARHYLNAPHVWPNKENPDAPLLVRADPSQRQPPRMEEDGSAVETGWEDVRQTDRRSVADQRDLRRSHRDTGRDDERDNSLAAAGPLISAKENPDAPTPSNPDDLSRSSAPDQNRSSAAAQRSYDRDVGDGAPRPYDRDAAADSLAAAGHRNYMRLYMQA